jgi:transposase
MANQIKTMNQIKEIYRLLCLSTSQREISSLLSISRRTVKSYVELLDKVGLSLEQMNQLSDERMMEIVASVKQQNTPLQDERHGILAKHFIYIEKELKRTGVTMQLLWGEYKAKNPSGYSYVQFCYHYRKYCQRNKAAFHFDHIIGDTLMIDYAGDKIGYVDQQTGELIQCQVLVTVLPYSGYTYAVAMHTQSQSDFITGMNSCFKFLGGSPKNILSDNLKTVVTKADRYEPKFSDLALQFAAHYQSNLQATRVAKPTDKGKVENAVKHVYRKIYAPLRNQIFHTLKQLNTAIIEQLEILNTKAFQGRTYSRADLFIEEKRMLNKLPELPFEVYKIKTAKVQRNYHIEIEKQYYSVPYQYVGSELQVQYTSTTVEIYNRQHQRVAIHTKIEKTHGYCTKPEHMPANHSSFLESRGWDADYFRTKASSIGPFTLAFIEKIFTTKTYIEQTYLSCKGLFRLVGIYNALRVEKACERLQNAQRVSYKMVEEVLKKNLDQAQPSQLQEPTIINHENLRANYN